MTTRVVFELYYNSFWLEKILIRIQELQLIFSILQNFTSLSSGYSFVIYFKWETIAEIKSSVILKSKQKELESFVRNGFFANLHFEGPYKHNVKAPTKRNWGDLFSRLMPTVVFAALTTLKSPKSFSIVVGNLSSHRECSSSAENVKSENDFCREI